MTKDATTAAFCRTWYHRKTYHLPHQAMFAICCWLSRHETCAINWDSSSCTTRIETTCVSANDLWALTPLPPLPPYLNLRRSHRTNSYPRKYLSLSLSWQWLNIMTQWQKMTKVFWSSYVIVIGGTNSDAELAGDSSHLPRLSQGGRSPMHSQKGCPWPKRHFCRPDRMRKTPPGGIVPQTAEGRIFRNSMA